MGAILRIVNLIPSIRTGLLAVIISYFFLFLIFLFPLGFFVNLITGSEPMLLNSRYLTGEIFTVSLSLALALYLNSNYMRNLLPQIAYYNFVALGLALAVIALLSLSLLSRKSRVLFVLFTLLVFSATGVFFTTSLREKNSSPTSIPSAYGLAEGRKVIVLYMEGLSLKDLLSSPRELPNFSYLINKGAWGKVNSPVPCLSEITFYSFLRGMKPSRSGYFSSKVYSFLGKGNFRLFPRWLFFQMMKKLGVIKLKRTIPMPDNGIVDVVKNYRGKADIVRGSNKIENRDTVAALFPEARPGTWQYSTLLEAVSTDSAAAEKALKMAKKNDFLVVRMEGLKLIKTRFLKYTSDYFPFVSPAELEKFMGVPGKYILFYDHILGRFLTQLPPDAFLLVVSPFSVEPVAPWRFYLEGLFGDKLTCGDFLDCPQGAYIAFSPWTNSTSAQVSLLDFAPTLAYYMGLPVEKESQGRVLTEWFKKEFFIENPILFIHSYGGMLRKGR